MHDSSTEEELYKSIGQFSDNYFNTLWDSQFYFQKENRCAGCRRLYLCQKWRHEAISCSLFVE